MALIIATVSDQVSILNGRKVIKQCFTESMEWNRNGNQYTQNRSGNKFILYSRETNPDDFFRF